MNISFPRDQFSHMPFIAHGAGPDVPPKAFCCLKVNNVWKIHQFFNDEWKRVNTGLPDNLTECSPCAEYDLITKQWKLSFIAGGDFHPFFLYQMNNLSISESAALIAADVGFTWKNRMVYAGRKEGVFLREENSHTLYNLRGVLYLLRVSYNPNQPNELLISGQHQDLSFFSWILNPVKKELFELSVEGEIAYKSALFNGKCFWARRENNGDFEARHIVCAEHYARKKLDYASIVSESAIPITSKDEAFL